METPMESQLRDMAILATIALVFVLQLLVLRLTSGREKDDWTRR